ncbi:MAG: fructoselysine 6-kinase [Solobacterium sp.]|nr:fructoselysine 6-kinase [Solobacterium sp.]
MEHGERKQKTLASFGSSCIDYYVNLNGGTAFAGGGPVNSAVIAASLGIRAKYVGAVGSDAYGAYLLRCMREKGVDTSRVHVVDGESALCEVTLADHERILGDYREGVLADFKLNEEDMRQIAEADICLCDLWGNQAEFFPKLKEAGACIAFDCADTPDDSRAQAVIPYCDLLFFSAEEDTPALREKMRSLQDQGPRIVVATLGSRGSLALQEDFVCCEACQPDAVIDSMGAGDTYIAGFLAGILNGMTLAEAMKQGSRLAAAALSYYGAFPQEGLR